MTQLVEEHRDEQQKRGQQTHEPADPSLSLGRRQSGDLLLKGHGEQDQDDEPAGVHLQGNPANAHQLPAIPHVILRQAWPASLIQS